MSYIVSLTRIGIYRAARAELCLTLNHLKRKLIRTMKNDPSQNIPNLSTKDAYYADGAQHEWVKIPRIYRHSIHSTALGIFKITNIDIATHNKYVKNNIVIYSEKSTLNNPTLHNYHKEYYKTPSME